MKVLGTFGRASRRMMMQDPEISVLISQDGFDVNETICPSSGMIPLWHVLFGVIGGRLNAERLVQVLSIAAVDVNKEHDGMTPLCIAAVRAP